jgi:hypothetical protein
MSYQVKEIFYTLQGEGANAGKPAVFCRFAGCNLWSGRERDRATAVCQFCDTDFVGTDGTLGGRFDSAAALAAQIAALWPTGFATQRFVVLTGGEPLLQVDAALIDALHAQGFEIAVETNGSIAAPTPAVVSAVLRGVTFNNTRNDLRAPTRVVLFSAATAPAGAPPAAFAAWPFFSAAAVVTLPSPPAANELLTLTCAVAPLPLTVGFGAGAPALLQVPLQALGQREVEDEAHVGLVDACAQGVGWRRGQWDTRAVWALGWDDAIVRLNEWMMRSIID